MISIVSLKNIAKEYTSSKKPRWKSPKINFNFHEGEITSILGPSGCGKTTILKLIANIIEPTNGEVLYYDKPIKYARGSNILGYVPQTLTLLPNRTVRSNILLPLELSKENDANNKGGIDELLNNFGLFECRDSYPFQLSLGMQQRTAIARAFVCNPEILLLDEPFASLDEIMREKLDMELLNTHSTLQNTIIFVTHSIEEAVLLSDRILILGNNNSSKPQEEVKVQFSQKRSPELKDSEEFISYSRLIRSILKKHA